LVKHKQMPLLNYIKGKRKTTQDIKWRPINNG
jgi:hypothetical protein